MTPRASGRFGSGLPTIAQPPAMAAALLASTADGLYIVDRDGALVLMNPAAEQLLGYSETDLLGGSMHDRIHFQSPPGKPLAPEDCPLLHVLRTGDATRVESDWFTRRDGTSFEVGYTSSPIVEDDVVTGSVVVFQDRTEQREVERRAEELAARQAHASAEWQSNLLPAQLPAVEGLEAAVSFRPVGVGDLIGGDFYDVIACGEGHLLVVGDVRGKGTGAAAVAAMVRYLLRGAAPTDADLRRLVALVNDELRGHQSGRFCTLVLAHLERRHDGTFAASVLCAGHPQPVLLRADGEVETVGGRGPLLGVLDDVVTSTQDVLLEGGDQLVLFSDGLTDVGRLDGREPFDVAAALRGAEAMSSAEVVSLVEQRAGIPVGDRLPDDIAILAARVTPPEQPGAVPLTPAGTAPADPAAIGHNEADAREENARLVEGRPQTEQTIAVACECGYADCRELIDITHELYERVRADDRCFFVVPGHELPRAERVVERHPAFNVVQKHTDAAEVAEERADEDDAER